MKKIVLLMLLLPMQALSQKTSVYIVPKGQEGEGGKITTIEYADSMVTLQWFPSGSYSPRHVTTKNQVVEGIELVNDTLWIGNSTFFWQSKFYGKIYDVKSQQLVWTNMKKLKLHHWKTEYIQSKYPAYYNKWFKK